jgi:hypothetical protein
MSRLFFVGLLLTAVCLTTHTTAADTAKTSPSDVVKALYNTCLKKSDGFDAASVALTKPYLSPDLYARIQRKLNQPVPKGDAPDIDGDLFLDAQDLPTSFVVGSTTLAGDKAQVLVTLKWSDEKRRYTVELQQIDGAWKVTDVNYGKDGKLSDLLK